MGRSGALFPRPRNDKTVHMSDNGKEDLPGQAVEFFHGAFDVPWESPVRPHQLRLEDAFQFDCHPGVSCFNECCRNIEIQLLPYDILRLKRRLGLTSDEFVAGYTLPFEMDQHGLTGLRLAARPGTRTCVFLDEDKGCTLYEDRPSACRYYALGNMGVRKKDSPVVEEAFFVVKEEHCKGHFEPKSRTVAEYREEQGVEEYDVANREWRDIVIKKRSAGPAIGAPSARSLQLFDMCSYDMDSFRRFIQSDGFRRLVALDDRQIRELVDEEDKLLQFAFRYLKQVLFGELTIPYHKQARLERLAQAKVRIAEREQEMIRRKRTLEDEKYSGSLDE